MRTLLFGLLAAALLPAAARATDAQDHTARYQREVKTALTERGWYITRDEAGKLVAERRVTSQYGLNEAVIGVNVDKRARLQISFHADGQNHTTSSARASLCYYNKLAPSNVDQTIYPPFALRDPKLTQEYREILAEAEWRLTGDSRKVAMK